MQFAPFKLLSFNSQLVQFNQRSAALGDALGCLLWSVHRRGRVEVIHDAFYHLRLAVITSNMSIKIAYAL